MEDFFSAFNNVLNAIDDFIWGVPLMVLILFGGILLTVRLGGLQFRQLPRALRYMVKNEKGGSGEVTSFGALCTALSATIGTGNIVGVATAVVVGGPGAMFWMWLAALFGMATKYSEGLLAVKFRSIDENTGHVLGGPFYYIERGMGKRICNLTSRSGDGQVVHVHRDAGILLVQRQTLVVQLLEAHTDATLQNNAALLQVA